MATMHTDPGPAGLPVLVVPYDEDAVHPMALAEAAAGVCRLCFAVDRRVPALATLAPLLARLGTVVGIGGCSREAAVDRIAAAAPDGVLALSERAMPLVAAIAERLDQPGPRPAMVPALTDKLAQRTALAAHGLAGPGCWPVDPGDPDALDALPADVRFPVVVKPRRGSGSRRTFAAASRAQLARLLEEDRSAAPVADPEAVSGELVVEEHVGGVPQPTAAFANYCSVELAGDGDHLAVVALTGRARLAEPFREAGLFLPDNLPPDEAEATGSAARTAVRALGAPAGCFHVEVKRTPDGPRVLEVNGRVGGGVPDLLRLVGGGFVLHRLAMRLALGEPLEAALEHTPVPVPTSGVAFRRFVQAPMGASTVAAIDGLDELRARPWIVELVTKRPPGAAVSWRLGTHDYVVSITGLAPDHDAYAARLAEVDRVVQVRYTRAMLANRA